MEVESVNRSTRMRVNAFLMFVIGMVMWVGVPVLWLWVGSKIKSETDSLGLAVVVMGVGALAMIVGLVRLLGSLNRTYLEEYAEHNNGIEAQRTPLEPVLVISVVMALAAFGVWFMVFAGGGGSTIAPQ
ncbi:MAG: hypothetical protein HZB14_06705 [Actinobacteria bacterium]|nr:hypothetical protein [Actinomycetota bacterium]